MSTKPPRLPAAKITTMTVNGWMFKDLPITFGVMTFPSSCCAISVMIQTQINIVGLCIMPMIPAGTNASPGNGA